MGQVLKGAAVNRRQILCLLGGASVFGLGGIRNAAAQEESIVDVDALKPGEFTWYPDRAPEGFVAIIVTLPDQRCYVYRNGVRIGVSTCSTGKPGHETPVGVFTILLKDVDHHSSLYNDASMPYTELLTWSGVALHAGGLPGYPTSHGCVHLPLAFSKLLFSVTHYGTPVIIADVHSQPMDVLHPGLVLPSDATKVILDDAPNSPEAKAADAVAPNVATVPVAMVVSGADRQLIVLKNGEEVLTAPVTVRDPQAPLGNVVYVLKKVGGEVAWTALAFEGNGVQGGKPATAIDRITVAAEANQKLAALLVPGSTMLITDLSAGADTRSQKDFVVLTQAMS
ncbi:L,D-transpeptidase [Ancylobacter pratisalsi]|uniref:L,D-transpeptidase n=1 Tax=Ancylobacter pratisalsi TaxID=1745854 RepID=A0A6P1YXQ4_9HYPH|nr:L,D-transpeptidase [Ancylobacter pratisalsi]